MLKTDIAALASRRLALSEARQTIKALLAAATEQEFLEFMFDIDGEPARRFIDSILNEYDSRRQDVLREMAESVPERQRAFFVHAFSPRSADDDPFQQPT